MDFPKFEAFPKIPRLNRTIIISEKIDGLVTYGEKQALAGAVHG